MTESHEHEDENATASSGSSGWLPVAGLAIAAAVGIGLFVKATQDAKAVRDAQFEELLQAAQPESPVALDDPPEESLSELQASLRSQPDNHELRIKVAMMIAPQNVGLAFDYLRKIPEESAEYLTAQKRIAALLIVTQQNEEAERLLITLAQLIPQDPDVPLAAAEFYIRQEDWRAALPYARRVSELLPDRVDILQLIAKICDHTNRWPEMISPLRRALQLEPDNYDAQARLAYALHSCGQNDEAHTLAATCTDLKPDDVFPRRLLASIERDRGNLAEAASHVAVALKLDPDDVETRIVESDLLMYERKPEAAFQTLLPLLKFNDSRLRFLGALLRAAAASGHASEVSQLRAMIEEIHAAAERRRSGTGRSGEGDQ